MPFAVSLGTGLAISAGVGAAGSIASGIMSSNAASSAANQESEATKLGIEQQQAMYAGNQAALSPFINTGQVAANDLRNWMPGGDPNQLMNSLQNTPGYQFTLQQGLESTAASAAARGLGVSGAALKGAANYATGLANNTYQNQFNNLLGISGQGIQSASALAGVGTQAATGISNSLTSMGQSQAAGTVGSANALSGGLNGVGGSVSNALMMNSLLGGNDIYGYNKLMSAVNAIPAGGNVYGSGVNPGFIPEGMN